MSDSIVPGAEAPEERPAASAGDTQRLERVAELAVRKSVPPPKSTAQVVVEGVVDALVVIATFALVAIGKLDAMVAVIVGGTIAGVRVTDLVGSRKPGGGAGGIAGLVALVVGHVLRGAS